ncbi:hypothetical protein Dxin01_02118 [Deinococcus xinjiangensis]|uniref:Excalibur calcium-binding domain-containing protein n=1 Tax=Deinococcus xinjiangensis TaxID=457454 RepID=A0ABP9VAT7_9DEIO
MTLFRFLPFLLTLSLASAQGGLTIRFLDVGQGDAVLITSPEGQSVMYDGGRTESRMRELIRQYQIRNVQAVIASHADADHITGLIPVVALNRPKFFINNGLAGTTQTWDRLMNVVAQAGTTGLKVNDQVLQLGSVKLTLLAPPVGMPRGYPNVNSVGLLVEYAGFRALMTGDSEALETAGWLRKYPASFLGPINVYKSIHHGASNGDNPVWLAAVRPQNVVVSVGPNSYGHPTRTALELYRKVGAVVYRTDLNGTVTVTVQPSGSFAITSEKGAASRPATAPSGLSSSPVPLTPPRARDAEPYYSNCAAVRAAGKAPLLRGQPGYRDGLDRDGDGRACE